MFFHKKRKINGFLLLDKPKGMSSNHALQIVKYIFNAKKAGYIGTLDPLATGILPICFGECTKFSSYLNNSQKKYYVVAKLGETTSTSDSEGVILKKRPVLFTSQKLYASIREFIGLIDQVPSMYSALKYNGIPLYKYARKGINIVRKKRQISIYNIDCIRQKHNFLSFNIVCSKGTYIRTVIEDLGEKLGCGAHVIVLRRIQIASYIDTESVKISDLNNFFNSTKYQIIRDFKKIDKLLMPIDAPVSFLPKIYISIQNSYNFQLGQIVSCSSNIKNSLVRVIKEEEKIFLGIGKIAAKNLLIPQRLVSGIH